jgi:hypothetical protein
MSHDHALVTSRHRARDDPQRTPPNERSFTPPWPASRAVERERTRGRRPLDYGAAGLCSAW